MGKSQNPRYVSIKYQNIRIRLLGHEFYSLALKVSGKTMEILRNAYLPFRIMWVKIPLVTSSASYPYGMPVFGYVSKMLDDQI